MCFLNGTSLGSSSSLLRTGQPWRERRAAQPFTRYSNNGPIKPEDLPLISCSGQLRHSVKRGVYLNTAVQPGGVRKSVNFWNRSSEEAFSLILLCCSLRRCRAAFGIILPYCTMLWDTSLLRASFCAGQFGLKTHSLRKNSYLLTR